MMWRYGKLSYVFIQRTYFKRQKNFITFCHLSQISIIHSIMSKFSSLGYICMIFHNSSCSPLFMLNYFVILFSIILFSNFIVILSDSIIVILSDKVW